MDDVAQKWLVHLQSGRMTPDELTELRAWLTADRAHRRAFEQARAAWRAVEALKLKYSPSIGTAPSGGPATPKVAARSATLGRRGFVSLALAAALSLVVVAPTILDWMRSDYSTVKGQIRWVTLPDGSVAGLNTNSAIAIRYSDDERAVELLRGEAWFRVEKNPARPFRVAAKGVVAQALGTAFDVRLAGNDVLVAVTEGEVAVQSTHEKRASDAVLALYRGEASHWQPNGSVTRLERFDPDIALAWQRNQLLIEQRPLREALAALDGYRPGRIVLLDDVRANTRVNAIIRLEDPDEGLEGLAASQGLHVSYFTRYLAIVH